MEANSFAIWRAKIPQDAIVVEDGSGRLVFVNDFLCRILGYKAEELLGQPWKILFLAQAQGPDRPFPRSEIHLRCKEGNLVRVLVTAWRLSIIGDPRQRRLSVFAPVEDDQYLRVRPSQGAAAIPEHRLASVAHELNNSLTVVTLQSQLLSHLEPTSPRLGEHLAIVQDQIAHMKRIVAELQVSSGRNGPEFQRIDVSALIRHTLEIQDLHLRLVDVQVITDFAPDLPQIPADPHRLEQVFVNLIKNACQALADADPPRVLWISTRAILGGNGRPWRIQICFANSGPAIPGELLPRIFEPFFTTKAPGEGTGLGLAICAQIVQEHKGRIWAESEVKDGAVFVVELPIDGAEAAERTLPPADFRPEPIRSTRPHAAAAGPHILLVDGESEALDSIEQLLRQVGFEVTAVPATQGGMPLAGSPPHHRRQAISSQ
jgi:two-component system NtrC family sensor kinase